MHFAWVSLSKQCDFIAACTVGCRVFISMQNRRFSTCQEIKMQEKLWSSNKNTNGFSCYSESAAFILDASGFVARAKESFIFYLLRFGSRSFFFFSKVVCSSKRQILISKAPAESFPSAPSVSASQTDWKWFCFHQQGGSTSSSSKSRIFNEDSPLANQTAFDVIMSNN